MSYDLKSIKKQFAEKGVFYTPLELANKLKNLAGINNIISVYDPTCGRGGLLSVFNDCVKKYGVEIDQNAVNDCSYLKNSNIKHGDTLELDHFEGLSFDLVIANPPFSVKYDPEKFINYTECPTVPSKSRADYAFILHCLDKISSDGVAVVLNAMGVTYRLGREGEIRQWLLQNNKIEKVVYFDGNTFVDTKIPTVAFVMRKNRNSNNVTFLCDKTNKSKNITLKEIQSNDYNLSKNLYLPDDIIEKEKIDPFQLEIDIQDKIIKALDAQIKITKTIVDNFGLDKKHLKDFLNKIQQVVDKYKE